MNDSVCLTAKVSWQIGRHAPERSRIFGNRASDSKHVSFDPRTYHLTARSHDASFPRPAFRHLAVAACCHRGGRFVPVGSCGQSRGSLERGALESRARILPAEPTVVERTVWDRKTTAVHTVQWDDEIGGHVDVADRRKGRGSVAAAVPSGS